ncbi:MAG: cytochrome c3 family protein, partial [Dehalococcoidia bacterium]|nr:cytochrome c3 family protein [Dehalococcoidia bacterium]
ACSIAMILLIAGAVACERAPKTTPAPAPVTTPTQAAGATPIATPTPAPTPVATTPRPAPTPKPILPVGLKIGERFHDIHTNDLKLKCETCHAKAVETYNDPLSQVSNLVDSRACLSCHKEGSAKPFYGDEWSKAKVGR